MIDIYNIDGSVLMQAELTSAAKREEELSKSDYIELSWTDAQKVILPVGSYILHTYKIDNTREVTRKFLLLEAYEPTQSDEQTWKYTPQFQHPKMILGKVPFYIFTKNSKNETVKQYIWNFVGVTNSLAAKLCDFLNNDLKFGNCGWTCIVSQDIDNTITVSFSDNDFISGLTAICNSIGDNCEWHIDYDNEIIYIGKVSIGESPIELKIGKNIGAVSVSESNEDYYNSFAVFGGTRNITQVNSKGENISSSDIRLQLNTGSGTMTIDGKERAYTIDDYSTIDLREDKVNEQQLTKVLDFSDVFPSLNTYVYNVRGREKYVIDSTATGVDKRVPLTYNNDGSVASYKTLTVWYMRLAYPSIEQVADKKLINTTIDDGTTHYWYDFEITDDLKVNNKTLSCSFEANYNAGALSTPLAGRGDNGDYVGFELNYHEVDASSHTSDDVSPDNFEIKAGDYEIVYQVDNDVYIPSNKSELIIPKGEDLPSLKCNITVLYNIAMADNYYISAQAELLDTAEEEIIRLLSDLNNYSFKSYPQVFEQDNPCLQIGQLVKYNDGNGYELETRVLKLSTNLDYEYIQEITVGNQAIKGTLTQLKDDVQSIITNGGASGYGNGSSYTSSQLNNLIAKFGTSHFLSKTSNDTAQGHITFKQGLTADGAVKANQGATFGEYVKSLYAGKGAGVDASGNAEVESLRVRSYMQVMELIVNRLSALEGDQLLTESDTIESVDDLGDSCYGLHLRSKWDGYFTAQTENNVLKGIVNTLTKGSGEYYTAWMKVNSVSTANNYIEVAMYADADVPSGKNYPPIASMNIARWGNQTDTTRQDCLYFSSTEGRIVKLKGVTKPILDKENYGVTIGTLPDFVSSLTDGDGNPLPIRDGLDYLYVPGIITMDTIRLNKWTGKPVVSYVDRGLWTSGEKYYCEAKNPDTEEYETSDVWYQGCKYRCCKNLTETAPAWNNTDWAMIEGNPAFTVDFEEVESLVDPDNINLTLTIVAMLYNIDVTQDIVDSDVSWTRYSEDADGNERVDSDNVWAAKHQNTGKSLTLTRDDMNMEAYTPKTIRFTATVVLRDGMGNEASTASVSYEY